MKTDARLGFVLKIGFNKVMAPAELFQAQCVQRLTDQLQDETCWEGVWNSAIQCSRALLASDLGVPIRAMFSEKCR